MEQAGGRGSSFPLWVHATNHPISAKVTNNQTEVFSWEDGWGHGIGRIVFRPNSLQYYMSYTGSLGYIKGEWDNPSPWLTLKG